MGRSCLALLAVRSRFCFDHTFKRRISNLESCFLFLIHIVGESPMSIMVYGDIGSHISLELGVFMVSC